MQNIQVIPPGEKPGPKYHVRVLPAKRKHSFQTTVAHGDWKFVKSIWDELTSTKIDPRTQAPVEQGWLYRGGKFNAAMDSCDGGELVARFNEQEGLVTLFNPEPDEVEEQEPQIEEPDSITFGTSITGGERIAIIDGSQLTEEEKDSVKSMFGKPSKLVSSFDGNQPSIETLEDDESPDSEPN